MSPRRTGLVAALLACWLGAGAVAGCSVQVDRHPTVISEGRLRQPTSSPSSGALGPRLMRVFLVRDNKLVTVYRPAPIGSSLRSALRALMEPLTRREQADGYRSALPGAAGVPQVHARAGIAYVSVPAGLDRLGVSEQILAVGQITDTLTLVHGVVAVQLVHDGHDVDIPVAGGELKPGPVTPADYEPVAAEPTRRPRSTTHPGSLSTGRSSSGSRG
jgi:hypothetical protein